MGASRCTLPRTHPSRGVRTLSPSGVPHRLPLLPGHDPGAGPHRRPRSRRRMRTLRVSFVADTEAWGGAETWLVHHLRRARRHDVEPSVVCAEPVADRFRPWVPAGSLAVVPLARHAVQAPATAAALAAQEPDVVLVNLVDPGSNAATMAAALAVAPTAAMLHLPGATGEGRERDSLAPLYGDLAILLTPSEAGARPGRAELTEPPGGGPGGRHRGGHPRPPPPAPPPPPPPGRGGPPPAAAAGPRRSPPPEDRGARTADAAEGHRRPAGGRARDGRRRPAPGGLHRWPRTGRGRPAGRGSRAARDLRRLGCRAAPVPGRRGRLLPALPARGAATRASRGHGRGSSLRRDRRRRRPGARRERGGPGAAGGATGARPRPVPAARGPRPEVPTGPGRAGVRRGPLRRRRHGSPDLRGAAVRPRGDGVPVGRLSPGASAALRSGHGGGGRRCRAAVRDFRRSRPRR